MKKMQRVIAVFTTLLFAIPLFSCAKSASAEHEHVWDNGELTTAPTCHSEGLMTFKCTVSGCKQTKTNNVPMLEHTWGEGVITKKSTCKEAGIMTYTCVNEGCGQTKQVYLDKADHTFVPGKLTKVPDLLKKGERELVCSVCGEKSAEEVDEHADFVEQYDNFKDNWVFGYLDSFDYVTQESIVPNPLTPESSVKVEKGSVTVDGIAVLGYKFSSDADKIQAITSISFKGKETNTRLSAYLVFVDHDNEIFDKFEINSDSQNWTYELSKEQAVNISQNDIVYLVLKNNGSGNPQGELSYQISAKCVHVWDLDNGTVISPSTCTKHGVISYPCKKCDLKHQEELEYAEHAYGDPVVLREATEDFEGIARKTCANCGHHEDEAIKKLPHTVANFVDDFSTWGENHWLYGYSTNYDWSTNNFTFNSLTRVDDNEWGGVNGLIIKKDWLLAERDEDGMNLAVGWEIYKGNESIDVDIAFTAPDASKDEQGNKQTRISARIYIVNKDGETKYCDFIQDGLEKADWTKNYKGLETADGDKLFVVLFKEADAWRQGALEINVTGTDGRRDGCINLEGKVETRFDDDGGKIDLAANTWTADYGYRAHAEVTKACSERWRAGMFINTGFEFEEGKTYSIHFKVTRKYETAYTLLIQDAQWSGESGQYVNLDTPVDVVNIDVCAKTASESVYFLLQMGDAVNEVTISELKIVENPAA